MDQPLPTRPQLELVWEFVASFVGSSWEEGRTVPIKDGFAEHDVNEQALHALFERWLRERRDEIIDYMVESDCAVESPMGGTKLDEAGCQRWTKGIAHAGPHEWDLVIDGETKDVFVCPGLSASPRTQIGGAHKVWPPRPGLPSEPVVISGEPKTGRSPMVSTHRNTQVLRDMGHDL